MSKHVNGQNGELNGSSSVDEYENESVTDSYSVISSRRDSIIQNPAFSNFNNNFTDERFNLLWPKPALIRQLQGKITIETDIAVSVNSGGRESLHKMLDVFENHRGHFAAAGITFR